MTFVQRETISVTTNTSSAATVFSTTVFTGRIATITYEAGGTLAGTCDYTITTETTKQDVWVELNQGGTGQLTQYPLAKANLPSGVASTLSEVPIYMANERLKIVLAQGGATKTGSFILVVA